MSTPPRPQSVFVGMIRLDVVWLFVSSVVVTWDAAFVLFRPRSLPGGDLHSIWKPYELYIRIDKEYGDMSNPFTIAQSWLNVVEVALAVATLILFLTKNKGAILLGFFVSSLTFWKTLLYMIQYTELCNGSHRVAHLSWLEYFMLFILPNGLWILFPFALIVHYGWQLLSILANSSKKKTS